MMLGSRIGWSRIEVGMVVLAALLATSTVRAGERLFSFTYEATTLAKGAVEFEQWVTWKTDKRSDSAFDRIDFRHEIEFGVTDRLQVGLYLSDWRYEDGASVANNGTDWRNVALELIYNLKDPATEDFGLALYGEVKFGDELFELEGKVIAEVQFDRWVVVWNGTIEAEWEGPQYSVDSGKLQQSVGASYQFSPKFTAGFELLHEVKYNDWSVWGDHTVYLGPNASYRTPNWWVTVTPMVQVTDVATEPDFQVRMIFGFDF